MSPPQLPRACAWCRSLLEQTARRDQAFCGKRCRQWAFRLRRRAGRLERAEQPMRFAYADPPYPGLAIRYYGDQPTFAGEVDHGQLVAKLESGGYDGWALSTSAKALRDVLPLCPDGARVCAWVKPIGASPLTHGLHNTWEPLIVVRGRQRQPGVRDWLSAAPARSGGDLPGRKPLAFCSFLFRALGMQAGDQFEDLFPGTGIVTRAWAEASRPGAGDASPAGARDGSPGDDDDPSLGADADPSPEYSANASPRGVGDAGTGLATTNAGGWL